MSDWPAWDGPEDELELDEGEPGHHLDGFDDEDDADDPD
jgi:hypothetical protein